MALVDGLGDIKPVVAVGYIEIVAGSDMPDIHFIGTTRKHLPLYRRIASRAWSRRSTAAILVDEIIYHLAFELPAGIAQVPVNADLLRSATGSTYHIFVSDHIYRESLDIISVITQSSDSSHTIHATAEPQQYSSFIVCHSLGKDSIFSAKKPSSDTSLCYECHTSR